MLTGEQPAVKQSKQETKAEQSDNLEDTIQNGCFLWGEGAERYGWYRMQKWTVKLWVETEEKKKPKTYRSLNFAFVMGCLTGAVILVGYTAYLSGGGGNGGGGSSVRGPVNDGSGRNCNGIGTGRAGCASCTRTIGASAGRVLSRVPPSRSRFHHLAGASLRNNHWARFEGRDHLHHFQVQAAI